MGTSTDLPYWSRSGLPSLTSTKRPPSPLEIRKSSSTYVNSNQDVPPRSPGNGILRGGRPYNEREILAAASCTGFRSCCTGERVMFCPNTSTLCGRSNWDLISGGLKLASVNWTCISEKTAKLACFNSVKHL